MTTYAEPAPAIDTIPADAMLSACVSRWIVSGDLSDEGIAGLLHLAQSANAYFKTMALPAAQEKDRALVLRLSGRWLESISVAVGLPASSRRAALESAFLSSMGQAAKEDARVAAIRMQEPEFFELVDKSERNRS